MLPQEDGSYVLDPQEISSVGRDLKRLQEKSTISPDKDVVAADPDYTLNLDQAVRSLSRATEREAGGVRHSPQGVRGAGLEFKPLPGTRREGRRIGDLLGVEPWLDVSVLERDLKQCRSPRILHIATHGYFQSDPTRDVQKQVTSWIEGKPLTGPGMENPLLRSGLALAGAQTWLERGQLPPEAEDGLLTAEDVTGMDLVGTEMVVLSACDTAMGEVRAGEGVFGLRRSFELAGARTLVMSLWKVDDGVTCQLMERFYHHLLNGKGRLAALRMAQAEIRKDYPSPADWGAFICQGDTSPMF